MSKFVLVHGAWHGPWCWDQVADGLRESGHEVRAPELHRGTLAADVAAVQKEITEMGGSPVVCGHSYGGMVISGLDPATVGRLVYLAAVVPNVGESAIELAATAPPTRLHERMVFTDDGMCLLSGDGISDFFFADCPADVQERAVGRLQPQEATCITEPSARAAWKGVPSSYIRCSQDRALDHELQIRLAARLGGERVDLQSSHSPFLSQPGRVVEILSRLAS